MGVEAAEAAVAGGEEGEKEDRKETARNGTAVDGSVLDVVGEDGVVAGRTRNRASRRGSSSNGGERGGKPVEEKKAGGRDRGGATVESQGEDSTGPREAEEEVVGETVQNENAKGSGEEKQGDEGGGGEGGDAVDAVDVDRQVNRQEEADPSKVEPAADVEPDNGAGGGDAGGGGGGDGKVDEPVEGDKGGEGEAGAEGEEAKVKNHTDDDDEEGESKGVDEGEAERVDVGAWAAAAPPGRSPILMVLHVDTHELSPSALCQLFGLYGDVIKVITPSGARFWHHFVPGKGLS